MKKIVKAIKKAKKVKQVSDIKKNNYIKIKDLGGATIFQPKIDIRSIDVVPYFIDEQHQTKKDIVYRLNYILVNGDTFIEKKPYKKISMAEKEAMKILKTLPAPQPISTIKQEIVSNNIPEQQEEPLIVGEQQHQVGFHI